MSFLSEGIEKQTSATGQVQNPLKAVGGDREYNGFSRTFHKHLGSIMAMRLGNMINSGETYLEIVHHPDSLERSNDYEKPCSHPVTWWLSLDSRDVTHSCMTLPLDIVDGNYELQLSSFNFCNISVWEK